STEMCASESDQLYLSLIRPACEVCHDFTDDSRNGIQVQDLSTVCHRCIFLRAIYDRLESSLIREYPDFDLTSSGPGTDKEIGLSSRGDGRWFAKYLWFRRRNPEESNERGDPFFYRYIDIQCIDTINKDDARELNTLSPLVWSPKSLESIQFIKDQLLECSSGQDSHKTCPTPERTKLPTRIIRIDPGGETIRLIETDEFDQGFYAALSHCWGPPGVHPVRTTGDTISKYKEPTPISELTAVFQDAIWLCKQLDIYDIWIDSLCIIQDDSHDWAAESSKMAQYYSNAYFTIAVERSWDSNTHFLRDAEERWQPMSYCTTDHDGHAVRYTIQEHYSHEAYLKGLSNYFRRGKEILLSRGWCLQEAVLSRRLIHFTPSDIIWECRNTMTCLDENHRPDSPDRTIRKRLTGLETWPAWQVREPLRPLLVLSRQISIHKTWTALVNKYTLRTLSFQEDKLPAFGGIASYFSQYFEGKYLAGIWESQLCVGLCWKVIETGQTAVRSLALESPTAPSWSWACLPVEVGVEGRETPLAGNFKQDLQVIIHQAECQLSSPKAPYGRISDGYIFLEAPLHKVQIGCICSSPKHPDWIQHSVTWESDAELPFESTITFRHDTLLTVRDGKVTKATNGRQLEYLTDVSSFQGTAWVVMLVGLKDDVEGLVLGQVGNDSVYQRLGHVRMTVAHKEMKAPPRSLVKII
ncbi:hypothetical protein LB507_008684, partial [Fusarium sp. FIESC RH6]